MVSQQASPKSDSSDQYLLMAWLSPGFPVGGYTYSHGIEYAVEAGLVHDRATLTLWVEAIVGHGAGLIDAGLLIAAATAVRADDRGAFRGIAERAQAWRASAETAIESAQQGKAFLDAVAAGWPDARRDAYAGELATNGIAPAYAVAVGLAAACADIADDLVAAAYLQAFAACLVSAGVRLIPLGQSDGVRALAALQDTVTATAALARTRELDDLGASALLTEWASMRHERQYTRLFRS